MTRSLTYRVTPEMSLHPLLAEGAQQGASDVHVRCDVKDDEQWSRLRVNGQLTEPHPPTKGLPQMMDEVFATTPLELVTPSDVFLHALGSTPGLDSADLMFAMEAEVDGQVTRWRANYASPNGPQVGTALVARLLPAKT